jgi:hypothetical protein
MSINRRIHNGRRGRRLTRAFGWACLLLLPLAVMAQGVSGRILGTVTDPSGAVVPNAAITVTNLDTGVVTKGATNSSGQYLVNNLNPGRYSVAAQASGFSTVVSTGDVVTVDNSTLVNFTLRVGEATTTVHVAGGAPVIDTTDSTMSEVLESKEVESLPLISNIFSQVIDTVPGAQMGGWGSAPESASGTGSTGAITAGVNGMGWTSTTYTIDGVSNMELMNSFMNITPSLDSIQEVKISTNDADPSVGSYGGAQVNAVIKSGTNAVHGTAYEFYQGEALEAQQWVNEGPITQVPAPPPMSPWNSHQFGGSIGGPILRNKLFYFGALQFLRLHNGYDYIGSEPTALVRQGIFPEGPSGYYYYPIYVPNSYNPSTGLATPWGYSAGTDLSAPGMPAGAYIGGCPSNAPPDSQCIPQSDWDPVAAKILSNTSFWPDAQNQNSRSSNFIKYVVNPDDTYKFDIKIDYQLNATNHVFGRESYQHRNQLENGPTEFLGEGVNSYPRDHNADIGWDHIFSATSTNQLRLGLNRFYTYDQAPDEGSNENTALGIPNGNNPSIPGAQGFANIYAGEYDSIGNGNWWTNAHRITNVYEVDDHYLKTLGRHNLSFGEDLRRMEASLTNANYPANGAMGFGSDMTSGCAGSGNGTCVSYAGSGFASFLLGVPDWVDQGFVLGSPNNWAMLWGIYGSDNWRLTQKLTLNLALRWDVITNPVESHNHQSNFDPNTGLLDLATSGNRHPNVDNYYGAVLPTVGFAYAMNHDRTVLRGAYGMTQYTEPFGGMAGFLEENYPWFEQLTEYESEANTPWRSVSAGNPYCPGCGAGLFPFVSPVTNGTTAVTIPSNVYVKYMPKDFRSGEEYDWNVGVEQKLGPTTGFTLSYVGTKGMHVARGLNINAMLPGGSYTYPFQSLDPQLPDAIFEQPSDGWSIWDALQAELRQNLSHGLTGKVSMSWSSEKDNEDTWDPYNEAVDTGGDGDIPFLINGDMVYELPFGKGRTWLSGSGPLNLLVGGWQTGGILNIYSGSPLQFWASYDALQTNGQISDWANKTCTRVPQIHSVNQWFDTSCYTDPSLDQLGNAGFDSSRAPRYTNFNMSLMKNTPLGRSERVTLQLRADAWNVFNHPQYGSPDTSIYDKLNPSSVGTYEFGSISGSQCCSRNLQVSGKIIF